LLCSLLLAGNTQEENRVWFFSVLLGFRLRDRQREKECFSGFSTLNQERKRCRESFDFRFPIFSKEWKMIDASLLFIETLKGSDHLRLNDQGLRRTHMFDESAYQIRNNH